MRLVGHFICIFCAGCFYLKFRVLQPTVLFPNILLDRDAFQLRSMYVKESDKIIPTLAFIFQLTATGWNVTVCTKYRHTPTHTKPISQISMKWTCHGHIPVPVYTVIKSAMYTPQTAYIPKLKSHSPSPISIHQTQRREQLEKQEISEIKQS